MPETRPEKPIKKPEEVDQPKAFPWVKLGLFLAFAALVIVGYTQFGDALDLHGLASRESQLRELQQQHPILVFGAAFAIYVAFTGLSLPGATILTL